MTHAPWLMKDIGSALAPACCDLQSLTAGGAGDGTEVECAIIDRDALGNPLSCVCYVFYETTLAATETLTLAADLDHGDDSGLSDAAQYSTGSASAVAETGAVTGKRGYIEFDVDLSGAKQYLRMQYTPTLSAAGTDTALLCAAMVFGGFAEIPA